MTPEQQRIAIAETCGWRRDGCSHIGQKHWPAYRHGDGRRTTFVNLPNYLKDLNAMHEAEMANVEYLDQQFYQELERLACESHGGKIPTGDHVTGFSGWIAHATASQRAEAFLKTLNLWTE